MARRVLHIVGESQFGGGAVLILRIAQEAASHGDQVSILSTNPRFQDEIRKNGLQVVDLNCIWREIRPLRDLMGLLRLYRYFRAARYDIVHTHTSKGGLVGRAAAFFANVPTVIHTVHGFAFHEDSSWVAIKIYSFIERLAAKWCDKIVTVSKYHRAWALNLKIADATHIVAIPNGISPDRIKRTRERDTVRAEFGIGPSDLVLVSVGRLAAQKGIEFLMAAVRALVDEGCGNFRVVLAGDGPLRGVLEQKVKSDNLERQFIFLGFHNDIADILNAADIAVMPTEREGLSISLLEAMAAGKPIVTTTIGSNIEVTENGRFARLVPPRNVEKLTTAIREVAQDLRHYEAMGKKAEAHFFAMYTERIMLDSYMTLYDRLDSRPLKRQQKS